MWNDNVVPFACPGRSAAVVRCGSGTAIKSERQRHGSRLVVDVRNEWPQLRYDRAQGAAVAAMSLYAYWRKVGDAALVLAKTVANPLK